MENNKIIIFDIIHRKTKLVLQQAAAFNICGMSIVWDWSALRGPSLLAPELRWSNSRLSSLSNVSRQQQQASPLPVTLKSPRSGRASSCCRIFCSKLNCAPEPMCACTFALGLIFAGKRENCPQSVTLPGAGSNIRWNHGISVMTYQVQYSADSDSEQKHRENQRMRMRIDLGLEFII